MAVRGIVALRAVQTSAPADVWAACIYPAQGAQTFGAVLANALRVWNPAVVFACDARTGRFMATIETSVKAALSALVPGVAADARPVPIYGQTASQWTLYSDPWNYAGGMLSSVTLPQLSKRTVGALLDRAMNADPASGFALVDQDNGRVRIWSDFNADASDALAAIVPTGQTVCGQFLGTFTPLIFEGGET